MKIQFTYKGGVGSGHFEHSGRPGMVGGSSPTRVKLTKRALKDFMEWSTSRYNEMKKSEAVTLAYQLLTDTLPEWRKNSGQYKSTMFHSGAYTESSTMSGSDYLVDIENRLISRGAAVTHKVEDFIAHDTIYFE